MPTYSYRCTECDTAFDIHQAFTDSSLTECPTCGGKLRKVFGSIGVTFNGSGFYRNDSRQTSSSTDKASATSGEKSSEKSATTPSTTPAPAAAASSAPAASSSSSTSTPKAAAPAAS